MGINTYELLSKDRGELPRFTAGAHIDVHVPGGYLRQYSLCNDPAEQDRYEISVLKVHDGRGGSSAMHAAVKTGDVLDISEPRNNFPLNRSARTHIMIAGGIGVTPMMAMVSQLERTGANYHLYYCTRSVEHTAFRNRLAPLVEAGKISYHHDNGVPENGLDIVELTRNHAAGSHLYCCGPTGLMEAVKRTTVHWPLGTVHFEYFKVASESVVPSTHSVEAADFKVRLARSGIELEVPKGKSIVDVLRDAGLECETSCESGLCGTCRTRYLAGEPVHNDYVLSDSERDEFVLICCAGCKSDALVLDI
ncbi:MAG: PDR/VanB family oxidoreductase [Gammaproteobacteria bacterium]|nr:PDR/VanB family oxidoreductase [Gammaproteobacteria bacterium]